MLQQIFKIIGYMSKPAFFENRNGVKGQACSFYDKNGDYHKRDGYGHEKIISLKKLNAYGKANDGKFYQSDIYRNLRHDFPEIKKQKQLHDLASLLIKGIKICDGEVQGSNYTDSKYFWITNTQELLEIGKIFSRYTDFKNEGEDCGINDL